MIRIATVLACIVLAGCQSQRLALGNKEEVAKASDQQVAMAWIDTNSPQLKQELIDRKYFTAEEWQQIDGRTYGVGTREMVVWAIKGRPDRVNEDAGIGGTSRQLCYNTDSYGIARSFVYTQDGRVTSWQTLGR